MALTKVQAAGLTADLIDETKLADNSIDSEHYNDGSIDNAHLADDAVGIAELSATGTASSSTFLRGDNSWQTVSTTPEGTAILSTGETGTAKFLRVDGDDSCSWQVPPDTNTTYSVGDGGLTQNNFTNTLKTKLDGIAASANAYVHPNHSGEVTSTADGATVIADDIVDEANLKVSNSPTNGYFLSAQSGNTGGLTWAEAGGGKLLQWGRIATTANQDLGTTYTFTDLTDLSIDFTPVSASSQLWITGHPYFRMTGSTTYYGFCRLRIQHDGSTVHEEQHVYKGYAQGGVATGIVAHSGLVPIFGYVTSTGSTSQRTIKLQAHNENNSNSALVMGPYTGMSFLTIMEIG